MSLVFFTVFLSEPKAELPQDGRSIPHKPVEPSKPQKRDHLVIRMLILKHSKEQMADNDADYAIKSLQKGANGGLKIKIIGNHFINSLGVSKLKDFISTEIKKDAEKGDTVIVHTIGHGHGSGNLHNLGQRSDVLKAIAGAAEENNQRVLWWQLSCHAAAKLPPINELTPAQQNLVSILASSTASQLSASMVEGKYMEKIFIALSQKSREIDLNGDVEITSNELKEFLNKIDTRKRGDLLFSKGGDTPIFSNTITTKLARRLIDDRIDREREGAIPQHPSGP